MYKPSSKQKIALDNLRNIDPNFQIKWDEKNGVPMHLRGKLSRSLTGDPELISMEFLNMHKNLFNVERPDEDLQIKDIGTDTNGNRHVRFQQKYRSLPVFGREIIVHINHENAVKGVNGKFAPSIDLPGKPDVLAEDAKKTILKHDKNNRERSDEVPKLLVFIHEDEPYLTWHMTVDGLDKALDGSETPARWEYFLNALTGKIIWRYNNEQTHTRTTGTGTGKYFGNVTVNTVHNHISNKYDLEDQWLPTTAKVVTHDTDNGLPPAPTSQDSNNNWSAPNQGAEVDCHVYTRMFYDYFLLVHGRDSYDDAGADMNIYAHCNINWNNASWNGSYVKIGDGDGVNNDALCTLDIVAHEWTHAVTEHTAGLIYNGESGALNESFSDVFAALIDGDWLQGEDCWLKATAPACRNLADPTNGGQYDPANPISSVLDGHQPDHMNDKYTGGADYGGVHINNSIMNKAAHLIATGGIHRGITICTDLGRDVLGKLYYHALTQYLIPSSDFSDMREAVLDSLDDLYAGDPRYNRWKASIINAFAAVGVGNAVNCPVICWIAPMICPPSPSITCPPSPLMACPPSPFVACPPSPFVACPPSPSITCPPSPSITCPPSPLMKCPPAPSISCPPAPHGCLPGPDPFPFFPKIITRIKTPLEKDLDILKVAGIGPEYASLLKSNNIHTVEELVHATESKDSIKVLADTVSVSENRLRNWRKMAKLLTR